MPPRSDAKAGRTPTVRNRRARFNYEILETFECGIMLAGSEVKSLREGKANLQDSYARIRDHEVWLHGMHVAPYPFARDELDPVRPRKLLLHRREIDELTRQTAERGMTLVPLQLFFKDHLVKVELGVARGKRTYDKRRTLAERDARRDIDRAMKDRRQAGQTH
ncbi:MAG TPA: SsrA-binding protein SmpB [Acidimicrobiia bacterium]|jgi:SsrA-binding protein